MQMKKFTKISTILILISIIFSSCSKKDPSPSPTNNKGINGSGCLISSIDSNGVNILNYEYNSDNRVSKINDVKNNSIITFSYSPSKITIQKNTGGTIVNAYADLGSDGFIKQLYNDDKIVDMEKITDTTYYTYDSNKYLIKSFQSIGGYIGVQYQFGTSLKTYNTIKNGNFDKSALIGGPYFAGDLQPTDTISKVDYDYYFDKPSQVFPFTSSTATSNALSSFMGSYPKNLVKGINITYPGIVMENFDYKFTDKGLINTVTITQSAYGNSMSYTLTLHYACK